MKKAEIEKKFLDIIIENINRNAEDWKIYSKEEIIRFLNLMNNIIK